MKTRQTLVSNSSSSSFILIGIPIEIDQLTKDHIITDNKAKLTTTIIGTYCGEGQDVFSLREEGQLAFIKEYPQLFKSAYIHTKFLYDAEEGFKFSELVKEYTALFGLAAMAQLDKTIILGGSADQNSSYSTKTIIENYEDMASEEMLEREKSKFRKKWNVE